MYLRIPKASGTLYTTKEFLEKCQDGTLKDSQGFGSWATDTHYYTDETLYPSTFKEDPKYPREYVWWITHEEIKEHERKFRARVHCPEIF